MRSNLADLVSEAAARRPGHAALIAEEGSDVASLTWADLDAEVNAAAAGFQARGLVPGDRVAMVLGNRWEFVAAYFGALRAGLVAVPLNPGLTEFELTRLLADASANLAVVGDDVAATVAAAAPDLALVVVGDEVATGANTAEPTRARPEPYDAFARPATAPTPHTSDVEDLALLLFTSGTSGRAKGAMLTHRALLANVANVAAVETETVREDDVVLLVLPLFHVYSLNGTLAAVADQAATAVLVPRFDAAGSLEVVRRHRVTNVPGAPPMFAAWAKQPDLREAFAGVRMLFTGAAPLTPAVFDEIAEACGLPVFEGYGLTEAAPGVSSTLVGGVAKPGSVGRPLPGVEVRLLDESGEEVEEGDPGEITVRGANLFSGYWPDGDGGPDDEGWFATGDVAFVDEDGDLVLVDRRKELVIVNGFNVYPREVEEALADHPGVAEVAVIGEPDPDTGESVTAYVVAVPGAVLDADALTAFAATRLARFKCPRRMEIVDALPHSATGKVAKGRLREQA
jgi:long-chain acyl-CoA synthetase